jgi:hypothetical protein
MPPGQRAIPCQQSLHVKTMSITQHDPARHRRTWNVETAGGDIGAQQRAGFSAAKLEEGRCALGLLLLPVDVADGDVHVVQQLRVVLDRVAAGEEHHHLQFDKWNDSAVRDHDLTCVHSSHTDCHA